MTKQTSTKIGLLFTLIAVLFGIQLYAECDMMAMIAKDDNKISNVEVGTSPYEDPEDYFQFMRDYSSNSTNNDGYGIIYFDKEGGYNPTTQSWFKTGANTYYTPGDQLDDAADAIMQASTSAKIVMGHDRNASSTSGYGSHPFTLTFNKKTYALMHNGTVNSVMKGRILSFLKNLEITNEQGSNVLWYGRFGDESYVNNPQYAPASEFIDSELLFHYIMAYYIKMGANDLVGSMYTALNDIGGQYYAEYDFNGIANCNVQNYLSNPGDGVVNFVISDGINLYAFRNSEVQTGSSNAYCLGFYETEDLIGIRTKGHYGTDDYPYGQEIRQFELAVFSPDNSPSDIAHYDHYDVSTQTVTPRPIFINRIPNFVKVLPYITHKFLKPSDLNSNFNQQYIYVTGTGLFTPTLWLSRDMTIPSTFELEEGNALAFVGKRTLTITGEVTVGLNAGIILNHRSNVIVDNDGKRKGNLTLLPGSRLYGSRGPIVSDGISTTEQYGDKVVAQNGAHIGTDQYTNGAIQTIISSCTDDIWSGIFINRPFCDTSGFFPTGTTYKFWGCDITKTQNLRMYGEPWGGTYNSTLSLKDTDFTNSGRVYVTNKHTLRITGTETDPCVFSNNSLTPISVSDALIKMQYVNVNYNNGNGIYVYNAGADNTSYLQSSTEQYSYIRNCNVQQNSSTGLYANNSTFLFLDTSVFNRNGSYGVYATGTTEFVGHGTPAGINYEDYIGVYGFFGNDIRNSGLAEYYGTQATYTFFRSYGLTTLTGGNVHSNFYDANYGTGNDNYLLMMSNWDSTTEVDVKGASVESTDLAHMYPSNNSAWKFRGERTFDDTAYENALAAISSQDYNQAYHLLKGIISNRMGIASAASALNLMYTAVECDNKDFDSLLGYLRSLPVTDGKVFNLAVKQNISRCLMAKKDYVQNIAMLENIINTTNDPNELLFAQTDQGYSYLQLVNAGQGCPVNCTVMPQTEDEFQQMVAGFEQECMDRIMSENPGMDNSDNNVPQNVVFGASNYPNPFNPETVISYQVPADSDVNVTVYNMRGQKVKTLVAQKQNMGNHKVVWAGTDDNQKPVGSGMYLYKVKAGNKSVIKKMLLVK